MKSIQNIVEQIVENNPVLEESLSRGILNLNATAKYLEPQIKKAVEKPFEKEAAVMALSRIKEKLVEKQVHETIRINKSNSFVLRSGLVGASIKKKKETEEKLLKLKDETGMDFREAFFTSMTETEFLVYFSSRYSQIVKNVLGSKEIKEEKKGLASICCTYNKKESKEPLLLLLRALAWNKISFENIIISDSEIVTILNEDQATKAYDIIRNLSKE